MALPTIAIIPGGFCSPVAYDKFADVLRQKGYNVLIPALTTTGDLSVWDDVKMIHDVLSPYFERAEKVILVGHSYGTVPAMLSTNDNTIKDRSFKGLKGGIVALGNVAGFAHPARGKNVMGTEDELPLMPYHTLEEGILHLEDTAKPLFYSDLPSQARDEAWAMTFKSQSRKSLTYLPNFIEADLTIPKAYVKCENDEVVSPTYQDSFIEVGRFAKVFTLPTGHFPFLSSPVELADIVGDFAKSVQEVQS